MRFDDRLKTVLGLPARSQHDRVVRWRQLVELLARVAGPASEQVEQAREEIRSERDSIDEPIRAATARAIARPQLPVDLVAYFAADKVTVAAPVLAAASLSGDQWKEVLAEASRDAHGFILTLHPELAEQAPVQAKGAPPAIPDASAQAPGDEQEAKAPIPSISEVVARFEKLRQSRREAAEAAEKAPVPGPEGSTGTLFRWEAGPSGEIAWVEGVPRGPLIGRSLANPGEHNGVDERIQRAFALRSPFRDAALKVSGDGPAAGQWKISGVPAFEPIDGRFAGYRGVAVRPQAMGSASETGRSQLDDNSLRELVHELKTPLNAIIGFAEIIDSQYLGPADYAYRERAAEIVAQARILLSAIEDLDLAARIRASEGGMSGMSEMSSVLAAVVPELQGRVSRLGATIEVNLADPGARCALEAGLAERIVRRFATGAIEGAGSGDKLTLSLEQDGRFCRVAMEGAKPRSKTKADLPATDFSDRLAGALAELAGGGIDSEGERRILRLPAA